MYQKLFFLLLLATPLLAQEIVTTTTSSASMRHMWRADWITHPTASAHDFGVFHFRRQARLDVVPEQCIIYVSADNRYRLFVNGQAICEGPARDDPWHWPYDTIDIAEYLQSGTNVIAVQVVNFGEFRSGGQFSVQTALILQCKDIPDFDTNAEWRVIRNNGMRANPITPDSFEEYYQVLGFYAGGPCDSLIAATYPWGWQLINFDDASWQQSRIIRKGAGRGFPYGNTWFLVPRRIDMLAKETRSIRGIARTKNISVSDAFLSGDQTLTVPPNSTISILFDQKVLTMGYPHLSFSKGKNSSIKLTYAESLYDENFLKGDRNAVAGKNIYGIFDVIQPDGGDNRFFRPLWLRTFRYLQIDITTKNAPLILEKFNYVFTAYPLEEKAVFQSDDESLTAIWDASWRALQLCGRETFFSDAYFEQMQYIGDTRVQALATMAVTGDTTLFKNALRHFDQSRRPNGLTQSRYPARELQIIPTYSLLYIAMVHDYFMYANDPEFIRTLLPGIESILAWFEARRDDSDLLTNMDWWNFCDWAPEYKVGMPPGADHGYSTLIALHYVYALQKAADMFEHIDNTKKAERYIKIARDVQNAVRAQCYNPEKQMFAETPGQEQFSQHTNIFAVLTRTHPPDEASELMRRVIQDTSLIQTTFYFKFYLFQALRQCGMGDAFNAQLDPWRDFIDLGLTTFPEDDSEAPRSDCHPWSSSPCFYMLSLIAGIQPADPGFQSILIEPNLGPLCKVNVHFPHPRGEIKLKLERQGEKGIRGTITVPKGLARAVFRWGGRDVELSAGEQAITF